MTASATQPKLAKRYDKASPGWRRKINALGYPAAYGEFFEQSVGADAESATWQVLDAGTGCGDFAKAFVDTVGAPEAITLLDISRAMLDRAEILLGEYVPRVESRCGTVEELDSVRTFDAVLCAHVIEHCGDYRKALAALARSLKPGGRLLLVASKPHWCTTLIRLLWRNKAFHPKTMCSLLTDAGFEQIQTVAFPSGPPSRTSFGYAARTPRVTR